MRKLFANYVINAMKRDPLIEVLLADLGYGVWPTPDWIHPDERIRNVGASEQVMLGEAIGLAQMGKKPICYSISPFLIYRPFEWIRNHLYIEQANVKLVGSGQPGDYAHEGYTHSIKEKELELLRAMWEPEIPIHTPETLTGAWIQEFLDYPGPAILLLRQ